MVVDIKERQLVGMMPTGIVTNSMSWRRLIEALRLTGDLRPDEVVTHIGVDLAGLSFRVEMQ